MSTRPLSNSLVRKIIEENGCFSLVYRRDRHLDRGGRRIYFYFRPHFAITMKDDKKDLLEQLRETLECGKITTGNKQVRLDIFSPKDAKNIMRVMSGHKFQNINRQRGYDLWEEAVEIINRNQKKKINAEKGKQGFVSTWANFDQRDLRRLFRIREEMKGYKKWRKSDYKWTHSLLARGY
jgi:hypothetical protein